MPKRLTQEEFEAKAREVHGDRYEYGEYPGSTKKMWICCKDHGWFEQPTASHLSGSGCRLCAYYPTR